MNENPYNPPQAITETSPRPRRLLRLALLAVGVGIVALLMLIFVARIETRPNRVRNAPAAPKNLPPQESENVVELTETKP